MSSSTNKKNPNSYLSKDRVVVHIWIGLAGVTCLERLLDPLLGDPMDCRRAISSQALRGILGLHNQEKNKKN